MIIKTSRTSSSSSSTTSSTTSSIGNGKFTSRGRRRHGSGTRKLRARMKSFRQRSRSSDRLRKQKPVTNTGNKSDSEESQRFPKRISLVIPKSDEIQNDSSPEAKLSDQRSITTAKESTVRTLHPVFRRINLPVEKSILTKENLQVSNSHQSESDSLDYLVYDELYDPAPQTPRYTTKPSLVLDRNSSKSNNASDSEESENISQYSLHDNDLHNNKSDKTTPSEKIIPSSDSNVQYVKDSADNYLNKSASGKTLGHRVPLYSSFPIFSPNVNRLVPRPRLIQPFHSLPTGHHVPPHLLSPIIIDDFSNSYHRAPLVPRPVPIPLAFLQPHVIPSPLLPPSENVKFHSHDDIFHGGQSPLESFEYNSHKDIFDTLNEDTLVPQSPAFFDPLYQSMFQYNFDDDHEVIDDQEQFTRNNDQYEDYDYESIEDEVSKVLCNQFN